MNMKKGFTLIELLAVIVILSVIALIATPMILGVVETAKKGAAISSALGYLDAVEKYMSIQEIDKKEYKITNDLIYSVEESTIYQMEEGKVSEDIYLNNIIEIKGNYPKDGYVEIKNNKISEAVLEENNYVVKCVDSKTCEIIGTYSRKIVNVESIKINELEEVKIKKGETIQLSTTILPENATNKKVKWTSSNEQIATVDSKGNVTGVSGGKVTITATSIDNGNLKDEINLSIPGELVIDLQKVEFTGDTSYVENNTTDGGIIINTISGWAGKRIYMDRSYYEGFNKVEVTYSFTPGYQYTIGEALSDGTTKTLKEGGAYDLAKTTITLTLSENNKSIYFTSGSLSAKLYIYSVKFIND